MRGVGGILLDGCQPGGWDELFSGALLVRFPMSAASVSSANPCNRWFHSPTEFCASLKQSKGSLKLPLCPRQPRCRGHPEALHVCQAYHVRHTCSLSCSTKRCMFGPCASEALESPEVAAYTRHRFHFVQVSTLVRKHILDMQDGRGFSMDSPLT